MSDGVSANSVAPPEWKRFFSKGDDGFLRFQNTYGGPTIGIRFSPRDIWVGVRWKRDALFTVSGVEPGDPVHPHPDEWLTVTGWFWTVCICLLPCLPIRIGGIQEAKRVR